MSDAGRRSADDGERGRRAWSADHKQRIIEGSFAPGASLAEVARRYGLNANMLYTWRRQERRAGGDGEPADIVPVKVVATPIALAAGPSSMGRIEIVLVGGERIIVVPDVDATALARIIKALTRPGRAELALR